MRGVEDRQEEAIHHLEQSGDVPERRREGDAGFVPDKTASVIRQTEAKNKGQVGQGHAQVPVPAHSARPQNTT